MTQSQSPSNMLGLDAYQQQAKNTATYADNVRILDSVGTSIAVYPFLGLAGEAGEVCDKIKKVMRDANGVLGDAKRLEIMYELGDLLWYVSECSRQLNYSLSYVARMNIQKLHDRKQRNALQGSGDNR